MRDVLLDAPFFQVALALTFVVVAAALLYRIDKGNRHLHGGLRAALGVIRALVLATIVLLMFRPVLRIEESTTRQPALIVLQDASRSVGADHEDWGATMDQWLGTLPSEPGEPGASVNVYTFGADLTQRKEGQPWAFNDPTTDLSTALDVLQGQWAGAPVGAVIVATDGRFNRGRNPEAMNSRIPAPLHTIALGDTSLQKDIRILRLLHNDVAGLGNRFPIEIELGAQGYEGTSEVRISGPGTNLSEEVNFDGSGAPITVQFLIEAEQPGIQRYRISVSTTENEENTGNNKRTAVIDIIESRKRILLAGPAPHPDQGAWSNALSGNINYEVTVQDLEDVAPDSGEERWDAAFLFSFDAGDMQAVQAYSSLREAGIPVGLIMDPLGDFAAAPSLGLGFEVNVVRQGLTADPRGGVNPAFPHFRLSEGAEEWMAEVPPLMAPFGEATWGPAHTPLLFQRIGGILTGNPLVTVTQTAESRGMVVLGEGSWRWRQVGYLRTGSHDLFDDFVGKLTQFLTSDPGVDRFRVEAPRILNEDQRLQMQARAYDATLQPFIGADIGLTLSDSTGAEFEYRFSSSNSGGYALDAGRWPEGTYTWRATTEIGGAAFERSGALEVRAMELEQNGRAADHATLRRLSLSAGGVTISPTQLDSLTRTMTESGRFTPERDWSERLQDIIKWKVLLYILIGLLSTEWILRRWAGTY
jgi:hypothetical protein